MEKLAIADLLPLIAEHASAADRERSVADPVIDALKQHTVMGFSATRNIGGSEQSVVRIGQELAAVAGTCASTAWVLWNHLCTFHLFAGLLGPSNADLLAAIVSNREWVCFPAGASTAVRGTVAGDELSLTGQAAFGSGGRYADWAGVSFMLEGVEKPQFGLISLHQAGVRIDADWFAMSLRASATDTVHYDDARLLAAQVVPFPFMYRKVFRDPERPMVADRYREDWVALSDLWLGFMAAGLVQACIDEVTEGIRDRIAIMGVKVAERPTVHVNLGQAQAKVNAAQDTVQQASAETDQRLADALIPTEEHYLRQVAASMTALQLCDEALRLLQRVMGGNGLREGPAFERRWRDFQAMPLHINAHQDRISEQFGRNLLGLDAENPF